MVKQIKGWNLSNKLYQNYNAYVQNFPGRKVKRIKHYTKTFIREENPDFIIFHVGTNELNSDKNAELVGKSITCLAKGIANDKKKITISGTTSRNDEWNKKANVVNDQQKEMRQIASIDLHSSLMH